MNKKALQELLDIILNLKYLGRIMENNNRKQYIFSLLISIILPIIIYFGLRSYLMNAYALIVSSAIPIVRAIYVLVKRKKADIFSIISIIGFAVSIVIFKLGNGNLFAIKVYHSIITGAIGLVILISAAIRKPILTTLIQKKMKVYIEHQDNQVLLKKMSVYNIIIGLFFLLDSVLHVFMAYLLSTNAYVIFSKIATIVLVAIVLFFAAYIEKRHKSQINRG